MNRAVAIVACPPCRGDTANDLNDLIVASIALAGAVTLATRNLDQFARVPGLAVERR